MVSTSVSGISVCAAATFFWRQLERSLVLAETYCSLDDDRMESSDLKVLGGVWPGGRLWLKLEVRRDSRVKNHLDRNGSFDRSALRVPRVNAKPNTAQTAEAR
jgi:hypothetical protein